MSSVTLQPQACAAVLTAVCPVSERAGEGSTGWEKQWVGPPGRPAAREKHVTPQVATGWQPGDADGQEGQLSPMRR